MGLADLSGSSVQSEVGHQGFAIGIVDIGFVFVMYIFYARPYFIPGRNKLVRWGVV